ncbi:hypothetical protein MSAN_02014100 [Mycena sanguinolenta]|uniref:Uncharacterized protein n=1 Tax=Mycena sanguinolenta TaxID=230812 RepID=A0A8H6XLP3_9AGAR|nr:hypothetical protein MSAN_02014100 [Mycena sanguinolenta]
MPRVEASPRRAKRGAQSPVPRRLARTAASVRAEAIATISSGSESISAPPIVKRERVPLTIPNPEFGAITWCYVAPCSSNTHKPAFASPQPAWRHPAELTYIRSAGKTWNDIAIVRFLVANAFSIPPRSANGSNPWVNVRCADGSDVVLPRGYRLPLLWVAKYLWTSVKLVLTAEPSIRQSEWDSTKFEILHIARLCAGLLSSARAQLDADVMERGWRWAQFDRALHRYWHDWLIMRDEFVRDFFREFGEEEYKGDVLELTWSRWVRKSHKGFALTKDESANGISAAEFMHGLVVREDGMFEWREDEAQAVPQHMQEDAADMAPPAPTPTSAFTHENEAVPPMVPEMPSYSQTTTPITAAEPSRLALWRSRPQPDSKNPFASTSAYHDLFRRSSRSQQAYRLRRPFFIPAPHMYRAEKQGAHGHGDEDEMQVDTPQLGQKTSRVVPTRIGGSVLRDIPIPESEPAAGPGEEKDEEREVQKKDQEMPLRTPELNQNSAPLQNHNPAPPLIAKGIESSANREDYEEDLDLLYPDPDHSSQTAPDRTLSANNSPSPSRPVSSVPALSSARFPAPAADGPPTAQLSAPPHDASRLTAPHVNPAPSLTSITAKADADTEAGMVAHFLQSCERLGEDMHALRVEVVQLRAGLRGCA